MKPNVRARQDTRIPSWCEPITRCDKGRVATFLAPCAPVAQEWNGTLTVVRRRLLIAADKKHASRKKSLREDGARNESHQPAYTALHSVRLASIRQRLPCHQVTLGRPFVMVVEPAAAVKRS